MFEDIEKKIIDTKKNDVMKEWMKESLPVLYNAMYRSFSAIAMETKIAIINAREEMKQWSEVNQDKVVACRSIFQEVLERYKGLDLRIKKLRHE